jgi:hypothetical protein
LLLERQFGNRLRAGGGLPQHEQRRDRKKALEQVSKESCRRLFKVTKKETVDNQYSLAYTPDKGNTVGYHKIHLAVGKQKDLVVQACDGYYFGQ